MLSGALLSLLSTVVVCGVASCPMLCNSMCCYRERNGLSPLKYLPLQLQGVVTESGDFIMSMPTSYSCRKCQFSTCCLEGVVDRVALKL